MDWLRRTLGWSDEAEADTEAECSPGLAASPPPPPISPPSSKSEPSTPQRSVFSFDGAYTWACQIITDFAKKQLQAYFRVTGQSMVDSGGAKFQDLYLQTDADAVAEYLLDMPCEIAGCFIGSLELKVHWRFLLGAPITVKLDRCYLVLRGYADADSFDADLASKRATSALRARLASWQALEDQRRSAGSSQQSAGMVDRILSMAAQRLEVIVTNVHVRLQETVADNPIPLSIGFTMKRFTLRSPTDESSAPASGDATSISGARVRKVLEMTDIAVYFGEGLPESEPSSESTSSSTTGR